MKSKRFASIGRVLGGMAFYLLLSAPAFLAGANNSHSFVIRKARVFDGHKVLSPADVWVEDGKIKALGTSLEGSVGLEDD
jgi:hypothetical protein